MTDGGRPAGAPPSPRNQRDEDRDDLLRIEQVAELTGLTKRTLRYYEELGLLQPPTRTEGNYRLYSPADVEQLRRIKRIRDLLGASLADIKKMVVSEEQREAVRSQYAHTTDPAARLQYLDQAERATREQLRLVDDKLAGLNEMRATLLERLRVYEERRAELRARLEGAGEGRGASGGEG